MLLIPGESTDAEQEACQVLWDFFGCHPGGVRALDSTLDELVHGGA